MIRTGPASGRANLARGFEISARLALAALLFAASDPTSGAPATPPARVRWAGLAETLFQTYGKDQGLPHPLVMALAQDGDGFIWVSTQGGLARWDGYRFRAYRPDPRDPGAAPDIWIPVLHTDFQGRLWAGCANGDLALYDRTGDRFITFAVGRGSLAGGDVRSIADDGAGGLWIGTGRGLEHLDVHTGQVTWRRHRADDPGSLPDDRVKVVLRDRAGGLWIGAASGLARLDPGSDVFRPVPLPPSTTSPGAAPVGALFEDRLGRLWIGTAGRGAFIIDGAAGAPRPVVATGAAASDVGEPRQGSGTINTIAAADAREVWLGVNSDGIIALDAATGATRHIRHDPTLPASLPHRQVSVMLRDRAGSLWVGGDAGLSRYTPNNGAILTVFGGSLRPGGVSSPDVLAVLPVRDDRIWLGFLGGGVDIIDPSRGRVGSLRGGPGGQDTTLPRSAVYAMARGSDAGEMLIATRRGLYRFDGGSDRVALVRVPGRDPRGAIHALLAITGDVWIAGAEDGLWTARTGRAAHHAFSRAESARLSDPELAALERGRFNDLWVAAFHGLNRVDLATHAVEVVRPDPADPRALPNAPVSSLLFDRQGRIWVGTLGGGIAVMVGRDAGGRPQFRRIGVADGLPTPSIGKLLLDRQGRVWASTDDGLAVIDPDTFAARAFHRAEGLAIGNNWVGAGAVTQEGEVLFGGQGGLTVVRPERLRPWEDHPPIVVTEARVGGQRVPAGRFNGAGSANPLVLGPHTNSLSVEFAALDYTAPERNLYAYRLDGFDHDWIYRDSTRRLADYTNLPPGRYTLRLRGSNRDGVWTTRELRLPIQVTPAWYQTLWFKAALAGLALAAALGLVQARTTWLRRRQRELERQIAERTRALAISSDSLRLANAELEAANAELARQAHSDPLTGLINRRRFFELAADELARARRHGRPCSVLMIDLDHFKRINDTFGHAGGDASLRAVARRLVETVREFDMVARMGGEELAVLLPETDTSSALLVAERVRSAVASLAVPHEGAVIRVTASIGVASWRASDPDIQAALSRADAALYRVKASGRDGVAEETPTVTTPPE